MRTIAVIPSLDPMRDELISLISALTSFGVRVTVFANGEKARVAALDLGVDVTSLGRNVGFGAAINYVAREKQSWDWLLIVNDDLSINIGEFGPAFERLAMAGPPQLVYFGPEGDRALPDLLSIFLNLSLLGRVFKGRQPKVDSPSYRSFSFVGINKRAWDECGGFDEVFPFTFEDSDFARRAADVGVEVLKPPVRGVVHDHSRTSSSYVDEVLPVVAWSAMKYVEKWARRPKRAKAILVAALILRFPLIFFSSAPKGRHVRGTVVAIRALTRNAMPDLPPFERSEL